MICPECHSEYRQGFYTCADCGVELVPHFEEKPGEHEKDVSFVTLMETFDIGLAALVQSILLGEGIEFYVLGQHGPQWDIMPAPKIIRVREDQAQRAFELLDHLENGEDTGISEQGEAEDI